MHKYSYDKYNSNDEGRGQAWRGIGIDAIKYDRRQGDYFKCSPMEGGWSDLSAAGGNGIGTLAISTTGAVIANLAVDGGWVAVDSATTNVDNSGAAFFFGGCTVKPGSNRTIVMKGILRARDNTAAGMQAFFGLMLSTLAVVPFSNDAFVGGATDYVGVYTTGNTGTLNKVYFAAKDNPAAASVSTLNVHTFLDGNVVTSGAEIVKFDIRINGTKNMELWVNNVQVAHDVPAAAIPEDTVLRPLISCQSAGTDDPLLEFQGIEVVSVPGVWG